MKHPTTTRPATRTLTVAALATGLLFSALPTAAAPAAETRPRRAKREAKPPAAPNPQAQTAFDDAHALVSNGQVAAALPLYERAVTLEPNRWDIWLEYAAALRLTQHFQRAARAAWITVEIDPNKGGGWRNLGSVLTNTRSWQSASGAYERFRTLTDFSGTAIDESINFSYHAWAAGEDSLAEGALDAVLKRDPDNVKALIDYGSLLATTGREAQSRATFEKAEALARTSSQAKLTEYLGYLLAQLEGPGISRPDNPIAYEILPKRFLQAPTKAKARDLSIDDEVTRRYSVFGGELSVRTPEALDGMFRVLDDPPAAIVALDAGDPGDVSCRLTLFRPSMTRKQLHDALATFFEEHVKPQANESEFAPVTVKSPSAQGYFVISKDSSFQKPGPNDYEYSYTAYLASDDLTIAVSVLTNRSREQFVPVFTELVESLRFASTAP